MTDRRTILLVEDNPDDAELTVRSLSKPGTGQALTWVRDGTEALDYLFCRGAYAQRNPLDAPVLILLDLKLPKVDGLEVLRQVKSDERTRTVPVVVMTSSREERDVRDCYRLGANSYVVKPVDYNELRQAVGQVGTYWLSLNQPPLPRIPRP